MEPRTTRSRSRQQKVNATAPSSPRARPTLVAIRKPEPRSPEGLPEDLSLFRPALPRRLITLLKSKQNKLHSLRNSLREESLAVSLSNADQVQEAIAATLIFAQEEAGTAVCVSSNGLLLTCAHCVAETDEDVDWNADHWLLFANGLVVRARCMAYDQSRDLALLTVKAAQAANSVVTPSSAPGRFAFTSLSPISPKLNDKLICVGQPGPIDLEVNNKANIATGYDVLHISNGRCRGLCKGQDPQDNAEIGALQHDCWTYWGHSGAPLFDLDRECRLAGLHSSWDDSTGTRRGVPWEAVNAFLAEHTIAEAW